MLSRGLQRIANACFGRIGAHDPEQYVFRILSSAFPEKARHAGPHVVRSLLLRASRKSELLNVPASLGVALLSLTMFAAGHGVIDDPIYANRFQDLPADTLTAELRVRRLQNSANQLIGSIVADSSAAGEDRAGG